MQEDQCTLEATIWCQAEAEEDRQYGLCLLFCRYITLEIMPGLKNKEKLTVKASTTKGHKMETHGLFIDFSSILCYSSKFREEHKIRPQIKLGHLY